MGVKLLKTWLGNPPGHVFPDMPGGVADLLVMRGFAERVSHSGNERSQRSADGQNRRTGDATSKRGGSKKTPRANS